MAETNSDDRNPLRSTGSQKTQVPAVAAPIRSNADPSTDAGPRRATRNENVLLVCAIAMLAAAVLRAEPLQSANDRSRWCTVWSLVERRTFQIDEIDQYQRFSTIDKVRHRKSADEPWHFYSSKPPLLSTIVAGLYFLERKTIGLGLFAHTQFVTRLLLIIVNLIPMALALISLRSTLIRLRVTEYARLFVIATAGFGSMVNPYLTTLNNHTPAVVCIVFCIAAIVRIKEAQHVRHGQSESDFWNLGFFAALGSCFELPSALFGIIAFLLAARARFWLTLTRFVPAALIPLAAFFVTNWICTGELKPFYTYYGTDKYIYVHNGVPSYWSNPRELDANQESWPVYLFHCVLGHHGILSLSPVLFLTIGGWIVACRRRESSASSGSDPPLRMHLLKSTLRIGLVLTIATLGFYLSRTENYNYGGNSVALRWMLWLTPFWWMALVPVLDSVRCTSRRFAIALLLLGMSVVSANWSQDRPWRPSWLYDAMRHSGLIDYSTPPATQTAP